MQLLTIAIPKLEEMQQEGEDGRKKIAEYTRYLTVALALMQSVAMAIGFGGKGLLVEFTALNVIVAIVTMTAGSAMLMWIGERITENGVGNGISIVLLFNIISTMPSDMITLYERFLQGKIVAVAVVTAVIIRSGYRSDGCILLSFYRMQSGEFRFSILKRCRDVRWLAVSHKHPVKSKYSRCYSCYLCFIPDVFPGGNCWIFPG